MPRPETCGATRARMNLLPRLLTRLALAVSAVTLSLSGCLASPYDDVADEEAITEDEALTGSLPVGTSLRTTANVNLRSGPSTANGVLTVIPLGTTVTLQDSAPSNGFYRISYGGKIGWTSGTYLEPAGGGTTGPADTTSTFTTTADVNLRSGPSTANSILAVIPLGTGVTVLQPDATNGFYNVRYNGTDGWTSGKYLTPGGTVTPTPTPGSNAFSGGKVWKFRASKLAVDIAVFIPAAAETAPEVDVVVYSHGLNVCSPVAKSPPLSFVTDAPFALGKIVDASKKPVVLVAPWFDWEHLNANGMATGGTNHKLGIPSNLNGVMAEVMEQIGKQRSAGTPALGALILAGHSRGYSFLNPLAAASADPEMKTGALAHLREVWAFDTGYACTISQWKAWMASKPSMDVSVYYRAGTQTASCGQQFASLAPSTGGHLTVHVAPEEHCAVPAVETPGLLAGLP